MRHTVTRRTPTIIGNGEPVDPNEQLAVAIGELTIVLKSLLAPTKEIAVNTGIVASTLRNASRFIKRWGPWLIAAIATWLGVSPTALKAVFAATGHPIPQ